jgi:outer membrane protein
MNLPMPRFLDLSAATLAGLALFATSMPSAQAQSLLSLYESARTVDAALQSAKFLYEANLAKAAQAEAVRYPTANLGASATRSYVDINNPSVERGTRSQSTTLSGSYPLYRPANHATLEQGRKGVELAQAQLLASEQDLVIRISQAYFDLLASQDTLTFVRAQKAATAEQLAAAKRNFEVGTTTITDTREAEARFDLVRAQEVAAENDLRVKQLALDQLAGVASAAPAGLVTPVKLPNPTPLDVEAWVAMADEAHPGILSARVNAEIARLEVDKAAAGHKPTLDLVASFSRNYNAGSATTAVTSISQNSSIGLSFNLPLFAGYATQNRIRETLYLEDKARADLELARRTIAQTTRAAYFGVLSALGQAQALEAAEISSQSALDANKLGYQVGVRINIDVLNAQSQLFQTKRDLAKARYDVLLGTLKLRLANGSLKPADIVDVNSLLRP